MSQFLKAVEVWRPEPMDGTLRLATSWYDQPSAFSSASQDLSFAYDEGLPGVSWAEKRPQIWTDLQTSQFLRADAAAETGIRCGITLPVFAGEVLLAVVALFCGSEAQATGVVEIWKSHEANDSELQLEDGFYGELSRFEWISRRLSMMRGRGLPGGAWESQCPLVMENLPQNNTFLRARNAAEAGITTGLALPFFDPRGGVQICTLLSTEQSPLAKRFEVWRLDQGSLRFDSGHCRGGVDLAEFYRGVRFAKNEGLLGKAWLTGIPLVRDYPETLNGETLQALYLPQFLNGRLTAVVVLVL